MKKISTLILTVLMTLTMSACTQRDTPINTDNKAPETKIIQVVMNQ